MLGLYEHLVYTLFIKSLVISASQTTIYNLKLEQTFYVKISSCEQIIYFCFKKIFFFGLVERKYYDRIWLGI